MEGQLKRRKSLTERYAQRFTWQLEFDNGKVIGIDPEAIADLPDAKTARLLARAVLAEVRAS